MEEQHLTPELFDAVVQGELPPSVMTTLIWRHLLAVCPECAEGVRVAFGEAARRFSYEESFRNAEAAVVNEKAGATLARRARRARRELQELLRTPRDQRQEKVRRAYSRFCSSALVELLLTACCDVIYDEPSEAFHLATLAGEVAQRADDAWAGELRVRAATAQANALRASGSLEQADAGFRVARQLLRQEEIVDAAVHAELDMREGHLRKDQRRLDEAEKLLSRAKLTYRVERQPLAVARVLLVLHSVHRRVGKLDLALTDLHEALRLLDSAEQPLLSLQARHNLANLLYECGDLAGARRVLAETQPLYERFGDRTLVLRRSWLEGRVARGEERFEEAARHLHRAAHGFEELGIGYDSALVALDLAEMLLAQGKTREVKAIARRLQPVLKLQDLHREAVAALALFQDAAAQELVNAALLERVRTRLEEARRLPCVAAGRSD